MTRRPYDAMTVFAEAHRACPDVQRRTARGQHHVVEYGGVRIAISDEGREFVSMTLFCPSCEASMCRTFHAKRYPTSSIPEWLKTACLTAAASSPAIH